VFFRNSGSFGVPAFRDISEFSVASTLLVGIPSALPAGIGLSASIDSLGRKNIGASDPGVSIGLSASIDSLDRKNIGASDPGVSIGLSASIDSLDRKNIGASGRYDFSGQLRLY
jgi:hypothetical protein